MSFNNSSSTNRTLRYDDGIDRMTLNTYYTMTGFNILLGVLFNAWVFFAIITSRDMRTAYRNKLVCMLLLNGFTKAIVCNVAELELTVSYFENNNFRRSCHYTTFVYVFRDTVELASAYSVLVFLVQYVSQILDYEPKRTHPPIRVLVGTVISMAGPWVLGLLLAPPLTYHFFTSRFGRTLQGCILMTSESMLVLEVLSKVLTRILGVLILTVAAFLYIRRRTGSGIAQSRRGMQLELIGRGPEIDHVMYYATYVCVWTAFSLLDMMNGAGIPYALVDSVSYYLASWCLNDLIAVVSPVCLMLFPDIRQRVKTWRPWYCPAPGIDLTVKYQSDHQMVEDASQP